MGGKPIDDAQFAKLFREGRARTGETFHDLALVFKAAAGTIARWEAGKSAPAQVSRKTILGHFKERDAAG